MAIMTAQVCEKCKKVMDYVKIENHFGQFVKIYQCPICKKLKPVLPDKID